MLGLVGPRGVGKTTMFLQYIKEHQSEQNMLYVSADYVYFSSHTLVDLADEFCREGGEYLFIDEIHTLIGAGSSPGSMDAANILKPALARGTIQCIGATTLDEYRKSIEKDGALERRFQKVQVEPTTVEETLQILENIKDR